ncbi:MAG: hypothetical protein HY901_02755 [Deltaproteobacteria bacterium]|nr:hypothetical protein [Deltaproteobacteria bacterium]
MAKALGIAAVVLSAAALVVALSRSAGGAPEAMANGQAREQIADQNEGSGVDDARLLSVEMELSRLARRVELLERAPAAPAGGAPTAAAAMTSEEEVKQLKALRSDVDALLTGEPLGTEEGRKRLKEVVRSIQEEAFQDRVAQRDQARVERIKRFVEEARLSSTQGQDLTRLLDEETKQRQALWEERRSAGQSDVPGGQPRVREQLRALREKTDESAKNLLSADQFTQYKTMRSEDRGEQRGGGHGGGRRGGGASP